MPQREKRNIETAKKKLVDSIAHAKNNNLKFKNKKIKKIIYKSKCRRTFSNLIRAFNDSEKVKSSLQQKLNSV